MYSYDYVNQKVRDSQSFRDATDNGRYMVSAADFIVGMSRESLEKLSRETGISQNDLQDFSDANRYIGP